MSVPDFSNETGIPKSRVYKWKQEGTNPKADDVKIITDWLNGEMENVPRELNDNTSTNNRLDTLLSVILAMSKDNTALISQHDKIVDTNSKIAETNRLLAQQLIKERSTENSPLEENRINQLVQFADLLEIIAEIGSGAKPWKSKKEGLEKLNRFVHAAVEAQSVTDIPA